MKQRLLDLLKDSPNQQQPLDCRPFAHQLQYDQDAFVVLPRAKPDDKFHQTATSRPFALRYLRFQFQSVSKREPLRYFLHQTSETL